MVIVKGRICGEFLLRMPGLTNNEISFLSVDRQLTASHPNIKLSNVMLANFAESPSFLFQNVNEF